MADPPALHLDTWDPEEPVDVPWELLWHIYVVANDKGGSGKTSIAANFSLMLLKKILVSDPEARLLVIDLNAQGNLTIHELGCPPELNDHGIGLLESLNKGTPLQPVTVRPGLDLIPGGGELKDDVQPLYSKLLRRFSLNADLRLLQCLLPIAGDYDYIIIDTPPENPPLQRLAMGAGRWVLATTKSDNGSVDGVDGMRQQFEQVRRVNPLLTLLGVALFATGRKSTQIHGKVRDRLKEILGANYYMFERHIGHSEAAAQESRNVDSQPLVELFDLLEAGAPHLPDTIKVVHEDYEVLTQQVLMRSHELKTLIERS